MSFRTTLALLLLLLLPQLALAQEEPDSVRRRDNCRRAAQVIDTGEPAPPTEWPWQYIGFCAPELRVEAYRRAIARVRFSMDPAAARRVIHRLAFFHDGRLFEDVSEIAGDPSASIPARVAAFMALAAVRDPSRVPLYEGFVGGLDEYGLPQGNCSARRSHDPEPTQGPVPLPADYLQRIGDLRRRVSLDVSEPPAVRSAAVCA